MRYRGILISLIALLLSTAAHAQSTTTLPASLFPSFADVQPSTLSGAEPSLFASEASSAEGGSSTSLSSAFANPSGQNPPVLGVLEQYHWELYGGYTFMRFYEAPRYTKNLNGLNIAGLFYPTAGMFGADGEFIGTFGSQDAHTAKFGAGLVGGRLRFTFPRGIEVWGHGLIGGAKFVPQTAFGNQTGLAYEVGGGADIGGVTRRWGLRVAVDMVATRFFNTGQYSPKFSAGFLYRF